MTSKFALTALRIGANILFYFMILVGVMYIITSVLQFAEKERFAKMSGRIITYTVKGPEASKPAFTYAADSTMRFKPVADTYTVQVGSRSGEGIYAFIKGLILILFGIAILYHLTKIFKKSTLEDPFNTHLLRRMKTLAILFIVSDIIKLIDYILFNSMMKSFYPGHGFQVLNDLGDGIITGLIIWTIMIVLQRGKEIKEEHALTV